MDIMMPIMNGYEAIKKIRDDSKFANLPVLALTARAMSDDKEKCLSLGFDDYVSKPIDKDELFRSITSALIKYNK
jgi:CheY-like chemotaxis protein